jgi:TP901 family phage tail tape measure protein
MPVDMGELQASLTLDKGDFDSELESAKGSLRGLGKVAAAAGAAVAGAATVIGTQAVRASADFERAITEAGIKVQATNETLAELEDAALSAGQATKFTATESANALTFLGQAGFSASQQVQALPDVLELAAAENMNVARTADIASNIMKGFGKEASEVNEISDLLVKTSQTANTNVQELGQAMSFAAPAARSAGVSMAETAAAVGALSDAGIKAGRAGRGVRTVLAKMGEVSKELGGDLSQSDIQAQGLAGSLQQLQKEGLNSGNALELFGRRHGVVVQAILQEGIPAFRDLTKEVKDNADAAGEAAEKQLDTLSGKFEQLRGSVNVALTALGDQLSPTIKDSTDLMRQYANEVAGAANSWERLLKVIPEGAMDVILGTAAAASPGISAEDVTQASRRQTTRQQRVDQLIEEGFLDEQNLADIMGLDQISGTLDRFNGALIETSDQMFISNKQLAEALNERERIERQTSKALSKATDRITKEIEFTEEAPGVSQFVPGAAATANMANRRGPFAEGTVFEGMKGAVEKNTQATKGLTQNMKNVRDAIGQRGVAGQPAKPAIGDALKAATKAQEERVRKETRGAAKGLASIVAGGAKGKTEGISGATGQAEGIASSVLSKAKSTTDKAKKAQDQYAQAVDRTAQSFLRLGGAIEQATTGQQKFGRAAQSIFGGIKTGVSVAAAGGGTPLGIAAGGAAALGGIISAFTGGQTADQKQQARQRRENRKQIKQFANRTAERLADEMEERQLQARVIRIDASGALVGSEREVSSRMADLLENEVGRREGFNI